MEKRTLLPAEIAVPLREAKKEGYHYVVAIHRDCPLGKSMTLISFHQDMLNAQEAIIKSPYRDFLTFHSISIILDYPHCFLRVRHNESI